ncbi:hypothetical protein Spith_1134 [Spirochaeta thermophila DSM 6578]|uniref:Outer membrane lipoprotein BamD-like domain-containing protein n=1 Tax=Winmispira thermophila (strain ATCC 700085 / DSM 6578 / Z-1203) TaxID=869211 RepID=G0GE53_WINT7|nr:tetratricopeptide repeat protein [Spirochaeta thermophila]AEJ61406.1 hypothetical protein Spith_1134 [Spirochaeta thermophila DSM 6578]
MRSRVTAVIVLVMYILSFPLGAQENGDEALLRHAFVLVKAGEYIQAKEVFSRLLSSADSPVYLEALFWYGKICLTLGEYDEARESLEAFLLKGGSHPLYEEALYQKGRLLYLEGDYQSCISHFNAFLASYPTSQFVPNALYWSAESLFSLGHFTEARPLYEHIVENYRSSPKAEAARYRMELIEYAMREEELLRLLKWSHEEYLKLAEELNQKERSYKEALSIYQQKLNQVPSLEEVEALKARIKELEAELSRLRQQTNESSR